MGAHGKTVMIGEVAEAGIDALRPGGDLAHVVVEDVTGPAAEESEGVLMAADQGLDAHGAGELGIEHPGEREDDDEGIEADRFSGWGSEAAEFGPMGLGLFARRGLETDGELRGGGGFESMEEAANDLDGAAKAHGDDLLGQADGGKAVLEETLAEVRVERFEFGRPGRRKEAGRPWRRARRMVLWLRPVSLAICRRE